MMILLHTKNIILAGFTLGFIAACSGTTTTGVGGGTGPGTGPCPIEGQVRNDVGVCVDDGSNGDDTRNGVTTGTFDGTIGSNGQAFAINNNAANLNHLEEVPMTLRVLKLVRTLEEDDLILSGELVNATITIGEKLSGVREVSIDFGDGPVNFDTDEGTGSFKYGDIYYNFSIDQESKYIVVMEAISYDPDITDGPDIAVGPDFADGDLNGQLYRAYTGFETDPAYLSALEGIAAVASYVGEFDLLLTSTAEGEDDDLTIDGTIEFTADFDAGTITVGTLIGTVVDPDDLTVEFSGGLPSTGGISGNGWNATIDGIAYDGETLADGGGQLDGVFYGPVGEETAGTIIVDAELSDGTLWDGGGGFVACTDDPSCLN